MDQPKHQPTLSQISHLFLSTVREKHQGGAGRPHRIPPSSSAAQTSGQSASGGVDLSAEEMAMVNEPARDVQLPPVTAVIAPHLGGRQFDCVRQLARSRAAQGSRVGLIEIDVAEFRLMSFSPATARASVEDAVEVDSFDRRAMTDAMGELAGEIDEWLLLVSNPRLPEGRALLREADAWCILSTSDHDGIVGAYRTLKGLSEIQKPALSLAVIDAVTMEDVEKVHRKLSGVCSQFLGWDLELEGAVGTGDDATECLLMCCRPVKDKAQVAAGIHWDVVQNLLNRSHEDKNGDATGFQKLAASPLKSSQPEIMDMPMRMTMEEEVIELPGQESSLGAVLSAVLERLKGTLAPCALVPPACPEARLAVDRDRRLVLLAIDKAGLSELCGIAAAYQWLLENRQLIAMALPQFAIDATQSPRLRLLVDQNDMQASLLGPMLQSEVVTIQAYRTVKWGQKRGLLLAA